MPTVTDTRPGALLADLARPRGGVFLRAEALAAGFARESIDRRLACGEWRAIHPDVYCASSSRIDDRGMIAAAVAHGGTRAVASHADAAALHRLEVQRRAGRRCITVPYGTWVQARPGLRVVRSRRLDGAAGNVGGIAATTLGRTVVDLAQILERPALHRVVADVVRRTALTVDHLAGQADALRGRSGLALLRQVCDELDPAHESDLETEGLALFIEAGFVDLEPQVEIMDSGLLVARVDFLDRERALAFEVDGWAFHGTPEAVAADARRDRRLADLGLEVVRFGTHALRRERAATLAECQRLWSTRVPGRRVQRLA